ncbi:hypothetical protein vseg_016564 [Gypsophila vaccaria]
MEQASKQILVGDRLSSLPDAILIEILSLLPLNLAITTDTLSKRWRHLWTQVTSVIISDRNINIKCDDLSAAALERSVRKLTSPFFHSSIVDFQGTVLAKSRINSLLHLIYRRTTRHLSISLPRSYAKNVRIPPSVLLTQTLVSLQLSLVSIHNNGGHLTAVELPNLKKLRVCSAPSQCEWLNQLTELCPLLEDLSFVFNFYRKAKIDLKIACPNLRQLCIDLGLNSHSKVAIDAPKLDYLEARFLQSSTTLCIGPDLIRLLGAKLEFLDDIHYSVQGSGRGLLQFYNAICDIRILTLNSGGLHTLATFQSLTRLTINMDLVCYFETMLAKLQLCPALDVLTLKFEQRPMFHKRELQNNPSDYCALGSLKKIEIDICYDELMLKKYFCNISNTLLERCLGLEHFSISVFGGRQWRKETTEEKTIKIEGSEYELCEMLHKCRRGSVRCEVLFIGRCLKMLRKAGLNGFRADRAAIAIK